MASIPREQDLKRLELIRQHFGEDSDERCLVGGRWVVRPGDGPWLFWFIDELLLELTTAQQLLERGE